jgi:predicted ATPase/transcriptional regulator with GAF, ATPase, and Fis domain
MNIADYDVAEEILRTGRYVICRGRRGWDGAAVLIKVPARMPPRAADIDALEREFELINRLMLAGVPRAYEVVHSNDTACLILEDRGLIPLARLCAGSPAPGLAEFFRIAIQLCAVLGELHQRDVVYGNLSPATTLIGDGGRDVQLLDFGVASRPGLDVRTAAPGAEVAAVYISPEQTGRINRAIDHRSDLYSAGATLYELLTGFPPFRSDDRLELIHAHIARTPQPPAAVDSAVPEQVSRIVMRLLAKAAEDRYQTARGVMHDLAACEREWLDTKAIPLFDLARRDVSDRFLIARKLYGRDQPLGELMTAFEDTCEGRTTLMLVSGYSGIGKTSLISELYKPIVRERGYFISGKFDQVVRNVPYGAVIQAFRGLVWQLLAESEERLSVWRARLSDALGTNGGVLAEVIPEIEFVIGTQAPPPPLDPAGAQNRFRYVFQSFVAALAQREHPLVVFLDDLQWVDAATLDLLNALVTSPQSRHLLFIGAFRDNEVDAGHLLTWAIRRLESSGAPLRRVWLGPLGLFDVVSLLCDTLRSERADVEPLATLILQKTHGNPFFVIQFLNALQQDGLLRFDPARPGWSFRVEAVAAAGFTDNVVDLMTRKIRRLSARAQGLLTLAACMGSRFEWSTYLTASGQPADDAAADLAEVVEAGLVQPQGAVGSGIARTAAAEARSPEGAAGRTAGTYTFLHDRVQQAAYELIPVDRRPQVHLDVARLLLAECGPEPAEDRLFEIVGHLNVGRALLSDPAEQRVAAHLNLAAGRKAKLSTAYESASGYLDAGIALLRDEHWVSEHELAFALHLEAAECHYLAGRFDRAERYFELLLARGHDALEQAQVHSLRIVLYENLSQYEEAISSGRDGLALFGITFPPRGPGIEAALDAEIDTIGTLLGGRRIASLIELPVMSDASVRMVMRILTSLWAPAYLAGDQYLARLISATMVRLSLAHGNAEDSAYGYVTHAITIGPVRGDYASAYEWGELALAVNERFNDSKRRAKIQQQFHAHVKLWRRPFDTCIPHAREARRSALESGDFTYAGYAAVSESWPAFVISRSLDRFVREYAPVLALLDRIRMTDFRAGLKVMLNWALALQGRTSGRMSLSDPQFDEDAFVGKYGSDAPILMMVFYTAKLHLAVLFGDCERGVDFARKARTVAVPGTLWPVLVDFWGSVALAGCGTEADAPDRLADLAAARDSLTRLAGNCPENFRCFSLLVSAEMQRIAGAEDEALELYEQAIAYARETDNLQQEALACEMCGRLRMARGDHATAAAFVQQAHRRYTEWGAFAKVRQLEATHGAALSADHGGPALPAAPAAPPAADTASLDMSTVLKVARAIAVEIELDGLLKTLMTIALENAGAQRGLFLQERDGTLMVEAEGVADGEPIRVREAIPWEQSDRLAHSVVRYVRRTGHSVVIGNAATDERFVRDPYIVRAGAKSILCVPIAHQGRSTGVLYLENNLTTDAFTPDRIEMMRILAAQAAISLENARLYEGMRTEVERRTAAERSLRDALAELEALKNRLEAENVYLQEEIRTQHNFNEIVGNAPALIEALHSVELVAPTESTVLILGETGSGKELFARAVHSRSRRHERPLVKVNCGAIAPGLVESELFGHVKGAFTGAIDKRVGRFELANGGTILLDEIGELPLDAQVKLLRVLQEQEFEPVGSSRTVRVDVRVIAATNRDLDDAVRAGTFRADLLYRLNVFPIAIPPLRERKPDVPLLAGLFVTGLARKLGKPLQGFSARSMERLMEYSWPGNVRELQNVVERAAILARGPVLELERGWAGQTPAVAHAAAVRQDADTLENVQRAHIAAVLKLTGGVVEGSRGAASLLGLHPNTLRSRMKKLGISPPPRSAS